MWPFLAMVAARAPRGHARLVVLAGGALVPLCLGARVLRPVMDNGAQLATLAAADHLRDYLAPDEPYLTMNEDLTIDRPHAWFFPCVVREVGVALRGGDYPPADLPGLGDVLASGPLLVIQPRVPTYFPRNLRGWLERHYVTAASFEPFDFRVPGMRLHGPARVDFEAVVGGVYLVDGPAIIDGQPAGAEVSLTRGPHAIEAPDAAEVFVRHQTRGMAANRIR
jgi:hypothetical protein